MSQDELWIIEVGDDVKTLAAEMQSLCDVGLVVDITMGDGTTKSGALIGVSSTTLLLEGWDSQTHRPSGVPYTIDLKRILRVAVP